VIAICVVAVVLGAGVFMYYRTREKYGPSFFRRTSEIISKRILHLTYVTADISDATEALYSKSKEASDALAMHKDLSEDMYAELICIFQLISTKKTDLASLKKLEELRDGMGRFSQRGVLGYLAARSQYRTHAFALGID